MSGSVIRDAVFLQVKGIDRYRERLLGGDWRIVYEISSNGVLLYTFMTHSFGTS
jgi:hypothetical protein